MPMVQRRKWRLFQNKANHVLPPALALVGLTKTALEAVSQDGRVRVPLWRMVPLGPGLGMSPGLGLGLAHPGTIASLALGRGPARPGIV